MDFCRHAAIAFSACVISAVILNPAAVAEEVRYFVTGDEAAAALGDLSEVPARDRTFFDIGNAELKRAPGPRDWLANHEERGQSFARYVRSSPNRITGERHIIYIQPLGEFSREEEEILCAMREFLAAYFQTEAALLTPLPLEKGKTIRRDNPHTGHPQVLAGSIMENILLPRLPADAFCMLGITGADLYPDPSWNFVFGQASLKGRTGVYSLARYDPAFYGEGKSREERLKTILVRALKVAAHETGHMFGLQHCIYCECLMNGSNHMEESDARPLALCPVCLRKLYWNRGFDAAERGRALRSFFASKGIPQGQMEDTGGEGERGPHDETCAPGK